MRRCMSPQSRNRISAGGNRDNVKVTVCTGFFEMARLGLGRIWAGCIGGLRGRSWTVLSSSANDGTMPAGVRGRVAAMGTERSAVDNVSGRSAAELLPGLFKRHWSVSGQRTVREAAAGLSAPGVKRPAHVRLAAGQWRNSAALRVPAERWRFPRWRQSLPGALIFGAVFALAACDETQKVVDDAARGAAKKAVAETLVTQFPQVPKAAVTPFTDCIIDNSSAGEIAEFARDSVVGISETTIILLRTVLQRPETQTCVARAGVAALGA